VSANLLLAWESRFVIDQMRDRAARGVAIDERRSSPAWRFTDGKSARGDVRVELVELTWVATRRCGSSCSFGRRPNAVTKLTSPITGLIVAMGLT
jgi:hypothetical protein